MARKAREKSSTGIYAVMLRGYEDIFESEDMRQAFEAAANKYLGAGLMGIRFLNARADMLVCESDKGISLDMKPLVTSFARTYNRKTGTDGKVFADRFKSVPIETKKLERECKAYLEGGAAPQPYLSGAAAKQQENKASNTVSAPSKQVEAEAPKITKAAQSVSIPNRSQAAAVREAPKPKKKKDLPSWLL